MAFRFIIDASYFVDILALTRAIYLLRKFDIISPCSIAICYKFLQLVPKGHIALRSNISQIPHGIYLAELNRVTIKFIIPHLFAKRTTQNILFLENFHKKQGQGVNLPNASNQKGFSLRRCSAAGGGAVEIANAIVIHLHLIRQLPPTPSPQGEGLVGGYMLRCSSMFCSAKRYVTAKPALR